MAVLLAAALLPVFVLVASAMVLALATVPVVVDLLATVAVAVALVGLTFVPATPILVPVSVVVAAPGVAALGVSLALTSCGRCHHLAQDLILPLPNSNLFFRVISKQVLKAGVVGIILGYF